MSPFVTFILESLSSAKFLVSSILSAVIGAIILFILQIVYKKYIPKKEGMSEVEFQKNIIYFSEDAHELFILAGSADFLIKNIGNINQYEKLSNQANDKSCHLLLSRNTSDKELLERLDNLNKKGVRIRLSRDLSIRGRVKKDNAGIKSCIAFQVGNRFKKIEIEHQDLSKLILKDFQKRMDSGVNPLIKCVIFDLAGVYCEGNISIFFNFIDSKLGIKIKNKSDYYLCIDKELNLNKEYSIEQFIEDHQNIEDHQKVSLSKENKQTIQEEWMKTWKPNKGFFDLAIKLQEKGYSIGIASNCDYRNGEKYKIMKEFTPFTLFFSYEVGLLKPDEKFFKYILEKFSCSPFQCLFIDDHRSNTSSAKKLGFNTIFINRDHDHNLEYLKQEMNLLGIDTK